MPGVVVTAIGHQGGHTLRPTYEEVCTGRTAETVMVVYDLDQVCQASGRRMVPFRSTE